MVLTLCLLAALSTGNSAPPSAPSGASETTQELILPPSADTEALRFGVEFRGAMRARFGQPLPLVPRKALETGFYSHLRPLLELHNDPSPDGFLPSENFRAKIGADFGYHFVLPAFHFQLGLVIEHESDHTTARFDEDAEPWFLSLNDVGIELRLSGSLGPLAYSASVSPQLYLATCTKLFSCERAFQGSTTVGAAAGASLSTRAEKWGIRPYLAAFGSVIVPHEQAIFERRAVIHGGLFRSGRFLQWELYALGFFGNDIGFSRQEVVTQAGVGATMHIPFH